MIRRLAVVLVAVWVVMIAPVATVKDQIKGFSVDVLITKNDTRVRPGMNANLRFPIVSLQEVLTLPVAAIFQEEDETVVYVKMAESDAAERRPIEIGESDFHQVEVRSGLEPGDVVWLEKPNDILEP